MDGKISEQTLAPLAIALCVGGASLLWAPLALLIVAALAAHALIRGTSQRFNIIEAAGPVLAAFVVGAFVGLAGGIGVLFVWRMFADTRWSVNEAVRLAQAAGRPAECAPKALAHAWFTPLYALTLVAFTAPHMIAGLPLDLPHVPLWVPATAGVLALGAVFDWALRRAADWRLGELAAAPALHLLTHHVLFVLALGLMIDVSAGVVMMMAWRLAHAAPLPKLDLTRWAFAAPRA